MASADTQQHSMAATLLEAAKQGDMATRRVLLPDGEIAALVAAAKAALAAGQHKPAAVLLHAVGRRERPALLEAVRSLGQDTPSKLVVQLTGELAGLLQADVEALNKEADGVKRGHAGLCILAKLLRLDVQQAEAVKVLSDHGGAAAAAAGDAAGRSTEAEGDDDGDRMQQ